MDGNIAPASGRLQQLAAFDHSVCCRAAELVVGQATVTVLRSASRYGDFGLSLTIGILLVTTVGWRHLAAFTAVSTIGVAVQKALKRRYLRPRPCERETGPPQRAPIPDRGSFPSGHTLHAVMGAVIVSYTVPYLTMLATVVAATIAASRVILGVHYPSDVVAGASIGALMGLAFCWVA